MASISAGIAEEALLAIDGGGVVTCIVRRVAGFSCSNGVTPASISNSRTPRE
jgi:hypothetical protein